MLRPFLTFFLLLLSCGAQGSSFFSVGAEISSFHRLREGGTHQEGQLNGVRFSFDRLRPCSWYWGGDYFYGTSDLKGATAAGSTLVSNLTDQIYELRGGFTLYNSCYRSGAFFTPFAGWGRFKEENVFVPPSPIPVTFTDTFDYITVGFLSGVNFTPLLSMGVNFKVKLMQNGQSKVTDDPLLEDVTLKMKEELQVRLDLPLLFAPSQSLRGMGFLFSPFYEFRHFGGREGYPFDYVDTKFNLFGARVALVYRF